MENLIGKKIPDMELEAFQGGEIKKIKLANLKKWAVLIFYPADFTFVCPTELGEMADKYSEFKKLGAEVLSVSTDTVFSHKAWHDASHTIAKIKYPMLADPTAKLCRSLGTYIEEEGMSLRASFIMNPQGVIKAYEIHDNSIGRSADEILRKLQASQFVSKNPNQVCPASWRPGKKALKPGLNLVGKI